MVLELLDPVKANQVRNAGGGAWVGDGRGFFLLSLFSLQEGTAPRRLADGRGAGSRPRGRRWRFADRGEMRGIFG